MGRLAVHVQQLDDVTCPSAPARQSSTVPPSWLCLQPPQGHLLAGASPGSPGFFVWDVATGTATPISVRRWFISSQPQLLPAGVPLGSTVGCAAGSLLSCWQVGSYRRPSRLRNVAGGPRARVPAALVPLRQLPAGGAAGGRVPHLGDAGGASLHGRMGRDCCDVHAAAQLCRACETVGCIVLPCHPPHSSSSFSSPTDLVVPELGCGRGRLLSGRPAGGGGLGPRLPLPATGL